MITPERRVSSSRDACSDEKDPKEFTITTNDSKPSIASSKRTQGEAFPPNSRVRLAEEYRKVFRQGRRFRKNGMQLVIALNQVGESRLGLAVSAKVGNAIRRNQLKRRLREIFRRNRAHFGNQLDFVVIPQKEVTLLKFDELKELFMGLAQRGIEFFSPDNPHSGMTRG